MRRASFCCIVLLLTLPVVSVRAADRWAEVKAGMSADETAQVLGRPLIRSEGKGFDLWIYDHGAEVVFYGGVIAWTVPAGSKTPQPDNESWDFYQAAPDQIALPFPKDNSFLPIPQLAPAKEKNSTTFRFIPKL